MQSGEDFVAARVSIDVPTEGIAGLREITQEMDRFRTSVEAANRSSDTFTGYLTRIAEAANQAAQAQQNVIGMLERTNEYQNQLVTGGAGGPAPRLNAGPQYENPFSEAMAGLGGSDRMPTTIPEATAQMNSLRANDPRAYLNRMASSGQIQAGDIPSSPNSDQIRETASRIAQRTQEHDRQAGGGGMVSGGTEGVAQQILNEMSPARGGGAGMGGLGTPRIPGAAGGGGGGLGDLLGGLGGMKGVGAAGAVGGGVLAALAAIQEGGTAYQGAKNMGLTRGGGAAEGMGYEMSIKAMAMNPFISSEQSRQIIQQGLRDGYTGQEFDTVTGFVAQNLKDLNMDISQSFALVKKNAMEGGQSIEGLGIALDALKESSKTGYRSLPDLLQSYQQTSSALVTGGMSGPAASREASISANTFADNPAAAGSMDQAVQAMANSSTGQALMMYQGGGALGNTAGLPAGALFFMGDDAGKGLNQALENVLKKKALDAWTREGKPIKGTSRYGRAGFFWYNTIQGYGVPWTIQQAKEWFDAFIEGKSPVAEGTEKADSSVAAELQPREKGFMERLSGVAGAQFGVSTNQFKIGAGAVKDFFTGKFDLDKYGEQTRANLEKHDDMGNPGMRINALDRVRDAYRDHGGVEFVDGEGKKVKLDQSNADQMNQLAQGQLKVRQRGSEGSGFTLQDAIGKTNEQLQQLGGIMARNSTVSGTLNVTIDPAAQRAGVSAPSTVQLTPHEQQANSGYGQATPNNAPPGFRTPSR